MVQSNSAAAVEGGRCPNRINLEFVSMSTRHSKRARKVGLTALLGAVLLSGCAVTA
jgi:hypothetical protein